MIVYFASDLLWASKIKAAADAAGITARPVRSVEMLEARLADSPVRGLVVDLDTPDIALTLIERTRAWERASVKDPGSLEGAALRIGIVAFGPHVDVENLRRAGEAGADRVLARGSFHGSIESILTALERGG